MELSGWRQLSYGFDNAQQYANFQTSNCYAPDTKLGGADDLGIACAASVQLWYGTHPAPGLGPSNPGHQAASFAPKAKKLQKWRTWTALYIRCAKRYLYKSENGGRVGTFGSSQKQRTLYVFIQSTYVCAHPHIWPHVSPTCMTTCVTAHCANTQFNNPCFSYKLIQILYSY